MKIIWIPESNIRKAVLYFSDTSMHRNDEVERYASELRGANMKTRRSMGETDWWQSPIDHCVVVQLLSINPLCGLTLNDIMFTEHGGRIHEPVWLCI